MKLLATGGVVSFFFSSLHFFSFPLFSLFVFCLFFIYISFVYFFNDICKIPTAAWPMQQRASPRCRALSLGPVPMVLIALPSTLEVRKQQNKTKQNKKTRTKNKSNLTITKQYIYLNCRNILQPE